MSEPVAWFYVEDGKRQGPVVVDELVNRILTGKVSRTGLVWHEGLAEWARAESLPEIAGQLPPPIPVPPALPKRDVASEQVRQPDTADKKECKLAREALEYALVGIFCFGIFLEPVAILKARQARKLIAADPSLSGAGKAKAALIIGTIMLSLWCLGLLARVLEEMAKVAH